ISKKTTGVDALDVAGSFTWGAEATWFLTPHVGVEAMYTQQSTEMSLTSGSVTGRLFDMTVRQIDGNVVYQFLPQAPAVQPFAFGGLGASIFRSADVDTESKLTWTIGAGVKWFPIRQVGARGHLRYKPTHLNDSSSSVCDPFGLCQGFLQQLEFAGGLVL